MRYGIHNLRLKWTLETEHPRFFVEHGRLRYSELKRKLNGVSERILVMQLKELVEDGLIHRIAHPEVPPRVDYELSEKGKTLENILNQLTVWGEENVTKNSR